MAWFHARKYINLVDYIWIVKSGLILSETLPLSLRWNSNGPHINLDTIRPSLPLLYPIKNLSPLSCRHPVAWHHVTTQTSSWATTIIGSSVSPREFATGLSTSLTMMVETPRWRRPRSSSSMRFLTRPSGLTTSPWISASTPSKTPAFDRGSSSATAALVRLGTASVTQSATTRGRAMMEGTAWGWGPATTGKDRMGFVTWSVTAYTTTTMMEIAVIRESQMSSRPASILNLLTGEVDEHWWGCLGGQLSVHLQLPKEKKKSKAIFSKEKNSQVTEGCTCPNLRCQAAFLHHSRVIVKQVTCANLSSLSPAVLESSMKWGRWVMRPKYTLVLTKQVERQPAAFLLAQQTDPCRVPNGLHEVSAWGRRPRFLRTLIQVLNANCNHRPYTTQLGNRTCESHILKMTYI